MAQHCGQQSAPSTWETITLWPMWSYIFCPYPNWTCVTNSIEEHLTSVAHFIPELALGQSYREQGEANGVTWAGIWAARVTQLQNNHT